MDDVVVYKKADDDLLLVVNASNREKILNWCARQLAGFDLKVQDRTQEVAMLALQGPSAMGILSAGLPGGQLESKLWRFETARLLDHEVMIACTGYTGEPGVEIFVEASAALEIWNGLMEAGRGLGLKPAGLGARDTLRLEMGYPLYGNDLDEHRTPLEAGLDWVVGFSKPDFIGRQALQAQKEKGVAQKLIGFKLLKPGVPRSGYPIYSGEKRIGTVTSGNLSPARNSIPPTPLIRLR